MILRKEQNHSTIRWPKMHAIFTTLHAIVSIFNLLNSILLTITFPPNEAYLASSVR